MRIAEGVFNRLRNGEEPDAVRATYRSQSQVCEGFRLYIDEQEKQIRESRADLAIAKEELEQTNSTHDRVRWETEELNKDVEGLRSETVHLQKIVKDKCVELEFLREGVEALRKRGFTQDVVTLIAESVDLNGPEVWRVLERIEGRARLDEEIETKRNTKDQRAREAALLDAKKQKVKDSLYAAQKQLARTEAKVAALGELANLFDSGLQAGYTLEDLRALLSFLIEKSIGRSPSQSITHLLQLIEAEKSLQDTRAEMRLAENRLATYLELEKQAKVRVELMEKTSVAAIEAQKAAGIECTKKYESEIIEWMHRIMLGFQSEIERAKACSADVAGLEQEKSQLEKLVAPAKALTGILESEEELRLVQPVHVLQLLERLELRFETFFSFLFSIFFTIGLQMI